MTPRDLPPPPPPNQAGQLPSNAYEEEAEDEEPGPPPPPRHRSTLLTVLEDLPHLPARDGEELAPCAEQAASSAVLTRGGGGLQPGVEVSVAEARFFGRSGEGGPSLGGS